MKADWEKISTDYITQKMTYSKLAEKYGLNKSTIAKKASAEKWPEKRQHFANKVVSKTVEKKATRKADKIIRLQGTVDQAADMIDLLFENQRPFRSKGKMNPKALKEGIGALKILVEVTRNIYDVPDHKTAQTLKLMREKLDLDKKRQDMGADDEGTGVIEIAEREASDDGQCEGDGES